MGNLEKAAKEFLRSRHPELTSGRFSQKMRQIYDQELEDPIDDFDPPQFIPDAYSIHNDLKTVVVYEIEDTSKLTEQKVSRMYDFWFVLDDAGWKLRVFIVDRYGHSETEIDIFQLGIILTHLQSKQ